MLEKPEDLELRATQDHFGFRLLEPVEKDWYVVQAMRTLLSVDASPFRLVFAGGTCLARAHKLVRRMSEDVDFKVLLNDMAPPSANMLRKELGALRDRITAGPADLRLRHRPDKLRGKCGSQSTLTEFRRLLQTIIEDDLKHNHMPGYSFALDGDMVEMRPKSNPKQLPLLPMAGSVIQLSESAYEEGRHWAPGWDIYGLEAEWREWVAKKNIVPRLPARHFVAFCKRCGKYPGFR